MRLGLGMIGAAADGDGPAARPARTPSWPKRPSTVVGALVAAAALSPAVLSRKGSPNIKGPGKLRYVVEQNFALLHEFERLAVRGNDVSNSTPPAFRWLAASSAETPHEDRIVIAFRAHGKRFERGRAPLLLSWWTVKSSYGGEPRDHSYPWVLPQPVTVRRLTFGVARSA